MPPPTQRVGGLGAFHSIATLAVIMLAQSLVHVREAVTGLAGAAIIGTALWTSVR